MSSAAQTRLKAALPHIALAVKMAQAQDPSGRVALAVLVKNPDGTGQITASFECEGFISDILEVLGYKDINELVMEMDDELGTEGETAPPSVSEPENHD